MKKILFFVLLLCNTIVLAQDSIRITGQLKNNTRFAKVVLQKYNIGKLNLAAMPIRDNKFTIMAPSEIQPGVYRLQYSQSSLFDFVEIIINGKEKEIAFQLDVLDPKRQLNFTMSEENKKWADFKNEQNVHLQNIEALNQLLLNYTQKESKIIKQAQKKLVKVQKEYVYHKEDFVKKNRNTWAASMVQNRPHYFTDVLAAKAQQDQNRKLHFWDNINTNNPKLVNTPLYTEHILNYLQEYINPQKEPTEEERNQGLIESVDVIMQKFSGNEITEKFALQYLQLGFKEIGNENVLQYLDETYQEVIDQCSDDTIEKTAFQKRMEGYEALKTGNNAPKAIFTSPKGEEYNLKEITKEKTILVFWASWCPYCEAQMPLIEEFAKKHNNYAVIAVSLDEDMSKYKEAIIKYPSLLHSCDYKKYKGRIVEDYYVYGTPTFIVLDKNKKIVGKYSNWENAKKEIQIQ